MSLFSALTVAVGGLAAQSDAIGNISDNLSNTSTIAFKTITTSFESLVTQSTAAQNDPGGVRATPSYENSLQGNLQQSQVTTSLAISGQGFFAVRPAATVSADGTTTFSANTDYTRRGDFTLNKSGYLVNGAGFYLTGYSVDPTTNVVNTASVNPIQVSALLDNPVASSTASYAANLPSSQAISASTYSSPSTIQIYDSLGNAHDMSFSWAKTGANSWNLKVNVVGGDVTTTGSGSSAVTTSSNYSAIVPVTFGTTNPGTLSSILPSSTTGASGSYAVSSNTTPGSGITATLTLPLNYLGAGGSTPLAVSLGTYDTSSGLTQFADSAIQVSSFEQNGIPRGSFQSLSVDKNGYVALNYDNGRSKTYYQIPIVQFFAQDQLQRVNGGSYQQTVDSGTARYSTPGTVGAGTIVGSSLESSTVDIATEFTNLIQAQRIYSANARTITTADNMLQEVINIIH